MAAPTGETGLLLSLAYQSNHLGDDHSHLIIILNVILPFFAIIAVILRFVARRMTRARLGWDDYLIIVSLVLFLVCTALTFYSVYLGFGKHVVRIGVPKVREILKISFWFTLVYGIAFPVLKLGILLLYQRLFPTPRFQRTILIVGVSFSTWWFAGLLLAIFDCTPINYTWNRIVNPSGGHCISEIRANYTICVFNLIIDIVLLALPVSQVWKLQMAPRKKVAISGIFLLGFFATLCSVLRLAFLPGLVGPQAAYDLTYTAWFQLIWGLFESYVGIICACLPVMWPLIDHLVHSKGLGEIFSWKLRTKENSTKGSVTRSPSGPTVATTDKSPSANTVSRVESDKGDQSIMYEGHASNSTKPASSNNENAEAGGADLEKGTQVKHESDS